MKMLELRKATASLAAYARGMKKEPMIFTAHGRPVAALVLITNADLEAITLSSNPKFMGLIQRSRARLRTARGISSDVMRQRLGLKPKHHGNGK